MNSFQAIITDTELTLSREWGSINDDLMQDEELSATSNEEANKVFAEWNADDDLNEIMEIDEQIGSNLLDDAIFCDEPCLSPTGPLEELVYMNVGEEQDKFFVPNLDDCPKNTKTAPTTKLEPKNSTATQDKVNSAQDPFAAHFKKLTESMRRSQETRGSLTLKTPTTKKYERTSTVNGVLTSVEKSSMQLQYYLEKDHQRIM